MLVFIDGVHGRRSDTSIQDTDQSTSNTCHRLKCLCSLSDLHRPNGVVLRQPPSKGPRHHHPLSFDRQLYWFDRLLLSTDHHPLSFDHQLYWFDRLLLSTDRHLLSSDRHHFDSVTNHSVFTIAILVLCYRSFMPIRHPHEYRTIIIVCFDHHPNWLFAQKRRIKWGEGGSWRG